MTDPGELVDSTMLGGLQPIRLPRARHERAQRPWWEAAHLCALRSVLEPGAIVYDVGAEQGDFTALYAMWGGRVVAVEPNPLAWPAIRLTMEANGVRPLACYAGFCGETDSPAAVAVDLEWPSCAAGAYDPATGFRSIAESPELPTITVDTLAGLVGPPQVVTVDVEGAEGVVLRGAGGVLDDARPYVFVSTHPDEWLAVYGDSRASLSAQMGGHGYRRVHLTDDPHERHDLWVPAERMWDQ